MKKIFRMIIFSAIAIFLTSLWDKGFIIKFDWQIYFKSVLLIALIYYLVVPLSKIILLPLNFLTLGFMSVVVYCFLFYFLTKYFSLIEIKSWIFSGFSIYGVGLRNTELSQLANVFVSAISVSAIINLLEKLI